MKPPSKKLFEEAYEFVRDEARGLAKENEEVLRELISGARKDTVVIQNTKLDVTRWAQDHPETESLAVIVEARRVRFLGWSQVTAFGFFRKKDGSITEMKEKDYYAHGY